MRTYERQVSITDKVRIVELNKCLAVNSDIKSQLKHDNFFISYKDAGNWHENPYKLHSVEKKYLYFNEEFWKLADKVGFNNKLWDLFPGCIIKPMDAIQLLDFNEDKVVWFDHASHLIYNIDAVNPISMPYYQSYISGITNQNFNLKRAQEILSKNPNVTELTPVSIPYYNAEPGRDRAIEFTVKLPQETHDLLCNYYRDVVKSKFWTCRVKDAIVWRPWLENNHGYNLDVLGLKECYIGKEE